MPEHPQVKAEREVREAMAVPLEQRQLTWDQERAKAAHQAYLSAVEQHFAQGEFAVIVWEGLPDYVQKAWMLACEAAARYT